MVAAAGAMEAAAAGDVADEGRAFAELQELLSREEYDSALKAAMPVSLEQTHVAVYCSLQTQRWAEARAAIRKLRQQQQQQQQDPQTTAAAAAGPFALEEAYCMYRLNSPQKALQPLRDLEQQQQLLQPEDAAAAAHLHAQLLHRCGRYREAFEEYAKMLASGGQHADRELTVRLRLIPCRCCCCGCCCCFRLPTRCRCCWFAATLLFGVLLLVLTRLQLRPVAAAAGCVAAAAAAACISAAELCAAEEGVSAAEAMNCLERGEGGELAGLLVQQAVLQQQRGHAAAAETVYAAVQAALDHQQQQQQQQQMDMVVAAVALNNSFVLSLQRRQPIREDLADALSRVGPLEAVQHKLTKPQALGIGVNRCLGLLQSGRVEEGLRAVTGLSSRLGHFAALERIRAVIQFVSGKIGKSEQTLRALLEETIPGQQQELCSPHFDLQLALAALLLQKGDRSQASSLLREVQQQLLELSKQQQTSSSSSSSRYLMLLGAVFELQQQAEGPEGALESLQIQTALEGVQGLAAVSASVDFSLAAAALAASLGRWEFAAAQSKQALQRLQQQQQQQQQLGSEAPAAELRALVSLAEALCRVDLDEAGVYVQRLMRYTPQSVSLLDADEIEARGLPVTRSRRVAGVAAGGRGAPLSETGSEARGQQQLKASKKRRKKKIRYPKGFDPTKPQLPPDPERWLPKHERSGYKKMMRRRKECGRGGAQGAVTAGTAEATTGFRDVGPTTAKTKAATEAPVAARVAGPRLFGAAPALRKQPQQERATDSPGARQAGARPLSPASRQSGPSFCICFGAPKSSSSNSSTNSSSTSSSSSSGER
ncbi:hypothetical protein Efla_007336 [Eimeria flavescens]